MRKWLKMRSGGMRVPVNSPHLKPYPHRIMSEEVGLHGMANKSLREEYAHIFTLPLFNLGYCDYLSRLMDETIEDWEQEVPVHEVSPAMPVDMRFHLTRWMEDLFHHLTANLTVKSLQNFRFIKVTGDEGCLKTRLGGGDYTVMVTLEDTTTSGGLIFPKKGTRRLGIVSPGAGSCTVFPTAFESAFNTVMAGNYYVLAFDVTLKVRNNR